jgi:hypothetical protein
LSSIICFFYLKSKQCINEYALHLSAFKTELKNNLDPKGEYLKKFEPVDKHFKDEKQLDQEFRVFDKKILTELEKNKFNHLLIVDKLSSNNSAKTDLEKK